MRLSQLLAGCQYTLMKGTIDTNVEHLCYHTSNVEQNSVFVCIDGAVVDGNEFIPEAIRRGAIAIVTTKIDDWAEYENITFVHVEDSRKALAQLSANYFEHPSKQITTIGITGTKGKTTTAYFLRKILELAGFKTALIGTIETLIGDEASPSINTTPESYMVQYTLRKAVDKGCQFVIMEVSSQGLKLHRVDGIIFDYAVFMNLGHDHIGENEHKDFDEYRECKGKLFEQCKTGIFNVDDENAAYMMEHCIGDIETFAIRHDAKHRAHDCKLYRNQQLLGSTFELTGWYDTHITLGVPGIFNVYNALAAVAVAAHFGVKESVLNFALSNVKVKGRVEIVSIPNTEYTLIVDYAHNAMSLESVLNTVKEYEHNCLFCMFGCGGNRDRNRRFEMGEISAKLSDVSVITSDNPRFEEPMAIIEDIVTGIKNQECTYVIEADRKEAIRYCMKNAQANDIIVLAGKGHEDYQEIQGKKYPMDERTLIWQICKEEGFVNIS